MASLGSISTSGAKTRRTFGHTVSEMSLRINFSLVERTRSGVPQARAYSGLTQSRFNINRSENKYRKLELVKLQLHGNVSQGCSLVNKTD